MHTTQSHANRPTDLEATHTHQTAQTSSSHTHFLIHTPPTEAHTHYLYTHVRIRETAKQLVLGETSVKGQDRLISQTLLPPTVHALHQHPYSLFLDCGGGGGGSFTTPGSLHLPESCGLELVPERRP